MAMKHVYAVPKPLQGRGDGEITVPSGTLGILLAFENDPEHLIRGYFCYRACVVWTLPDKTEAVSRFLLNGFNNHCELVNDP